MVFKDRKTNKEQSYTVGNKKNTSNLGPFLLNLLNFNYDSLNIFQQIVILCIFHEMEDTEYSSV